MLNYQQKALGACATNAKHRSMTMSSPSSSGEVGYLEGPAAKGVCNDALKASRKYWPNLYVSCGVGSGSPLSTRVVSWR